MPESIKSPEERYARRQWIFGTVWIVMLLLLTRPGPALGQTAEEMEQTLWQSVKCESAGEVQVYLEEYPTGRYVAEAWACLEGQLGLDRAARTLVQQGLRALNYSSEPADGLFGRATRRAIRVWQQAKEYVATGYLTREQAETLIDRGHEEVRRADDAAYAEARRMDTREAYEEYLAAYPAGRHVAEAREAMEPTSPAPAQTVKSAQDYIGRVKTLLVLFEMTILGAEWEESHNPKFDGLNDRDSDSFEFTLEEGRTYRVASVCDADCSDIDLTLYDENDNLISRDIEDDDLPIVEVSPSWTGRFRLEVDMRSCSSNPCYYGIGIFRREQQEAEPQARLTPEARNSLGMEFVLVEPGTFKMGSPAGDKDELPHQVTISQPFYLGKYEVTQGQWEAVMGTNPSEFSSCGSDCPVERVSWEDVQAFIAALNRREEGNIYRLPTEAEWEYAARGGTRTAFSFGDAATELGQYGWYMRNSERRTHPVGGKQSNAFGLFDMHGNVWEWVADWYGDYPHDPVTDPHGPPSGAHRVFRGGSWSNAARSCRVSFRNHDTPTDRLKILGFRLARTP